VHDRAKEMRLGRASIRNWPSESNLLSVMSVALCHAAICHALHCPKSLSPSLRSAFCGRAPTRWVLCAAQAQARRPGASPSGPAPRPRLGYLFPAITSAIRVRGLRFRHKALGSIAHCLVIAFAARRCGGALPPPSLFYFFYLALLGVCGPSSGPHNQGEHNCSSVAPWSASFGPH
jgi:hypothetical protein